MYGNLFDAGVVGHERQRMSGSDVAVPWSEPRPSVEEEKTYVKRPRLIIDGCGAHNFTFEGAGVCRHDIQSWNVGKRRD